MQGRLLRDSREISLVPAEKHSGNLSAVNCDRAVSPIAPSAGWISRLVSYFRAVLSPAFRDVWYGNWQSRSDDIARDPLRARARKTWPYLRVLHLRNALQQFRSFNPFSAPWYPDNRSESLIVTRTREASRRERERERGKRREKGGRIILRKFLCRLMEY